METIVMNQGMLVSGIILAASFILIFTETLHGFHRVKVAMAGAAVMLVVGPVSYTHLTLPTILRV